MSNYTLTFDDPGSLLQDEIKSNLINNAYYVVSLIDRYVEWRGTLDFEIAIRPASELTWSDADGLLPSIVQASWDGNSWHNDLVNEILTGHDSDPLHPDVGCTIYLSEDGTIRNYGSPVWLDPNPQFGQSANVPTGYHDFVGIFTHEVFHGLGFAGYTEGWKEHVVFDGENFFFNGEKVNEILDGPLMLERWTRTDGSAPDHYGNTYDPDNEIYSGLLFQWGNYEGNRLVFPT